RTPDGCPATADSNEDSPTAAGTCDLVGDLDLIASSDAESDGQDYIEGGGGNDIVFGGPGQDDILGGSSDFFSLDDAHALSLSVSDPDLEILVGAHLRPDGSDILFGGSGEHTGRNDNGGTPLGDAVPTDRHAHDADTIIADNGRIIRIVGTGGVDLQDEDPTAKYVGFLYDDAYGEQIVVRGVHLLDYTPGGPDLYPAVFNVATDGPCADSGAETVTGCSIRVDVEQGRNRWDSPGHVEIAGNDEVHGGLGDDTIYLGGGNDVAYGDADDDDIIGGWGNDWISGGVGSDGIIGDDGRIFTSRNNDTVGEPLFGVAPLNSAGTCTEKKTVLCQTYLDQWIATPGNVQTAVINITGDLKKAVDLTPYDLDPNAANTDRPLFDANNSDDVIFGGLGGERMYYPDSIFGLKNNDPVPTGFRAIQGDFIHGGSGDDAIAGGEAIWNAYTQIYSVVDGTLLPNAYRTDWSRPYNPGDMLHFGADADAWHDQGPIVNRLGEFAIYDEYDPRRTTMLNADGTVNKDGEGTALHWFLNLYRNEGPTESGCVSYAPNGTCLAHDF
ncbi:MAG: hypothetical protein U9R51_09910, partial [Actinomycetota bacterium]|nr:hypothetical protein [Actinomycetota bacterium]